MTEHRDDDDECPGCGSSFLEREKRAKKFTEEHIRTCLDECPHCGALKCCLCDMGDDVECISCPKDWG